MEPDGALDAALEFVYDFIIIADKFFELFWSRRDSRWPIDISL